MSNTDPIRVWPFYDAPQELQDLSPHGGDEDWIAHVPAWLVKRGDEIWWAEEYSPFGRGGVSTHDLPDGSRVLIGAHS